jgi:hypothetical protein
MEGLTAVQYTLTGDTAEAKVLWERKDVGTRHASAVVTDDLILCGPLGRSLKGPLALDPLTGNTLGNNKDLKDFAVSWGPIAGADVWIVGRWEWGEFILLSADKNLKELGRYTLSGDMPVLPKSKDGKPSAPRFGRFWQASPMLMSGNRLFIRSFKRVYCIGDPAAPMTLSPQHQ